MEKCVILPSTLRSCLKGTLDSHIDGKIVGKDGKPMNAMRHETSNGGTVHEETVTVTKSLKDILIAYNVLVRLGDPNVENADVVLPLATFTAAQQRYANSLVGYFVGKNVAFPLVQNYVLEQGPWLIRNIPIILTKWSPNLALTKDKMDLSLIATQIGKPVMLDAFTSTMCADPWGRMGYARALIEVSAEKELKQNPLWLFTEEEVQVTMEQNTDGFTTVTNRKKKGKQPQTNHARKIEGLKLNKPKATFVYRHQISEPARTMETNSDDIDLFTLKNQFDSLRDQDDLLKENEVGETSSAYAMNKDTNLNEDSESVFEEVGLNRTPKQSEVRHVVNENRLSICAILESHVDISALSKVCSKVFRSWDWTSNANLCTKGCRIILGWNLDVGYVIVSPQNSPE
ncbi:hypothetical protein Tco_0374070 [Tanacetum coccineum]